MTTKNIAQLSIGDVIYYYGGSFRVTSLPYESQSHRPLSEHLTTAPGPANCVKFDSVCIASQILNGFKIGGDWQFQGTVGGSYAVSYWVE